MIIRSSPNGPLVAAVLALVALCWINVARADVAPAIEAAERIRSVAERYVAGQVAPTAQVSAQALDNRLRLPACPQSLDARAANPALRGAWSILVSCRDGEAALWSIFVTVKVADLRPVLVATRSIPPGQPITADMLRTENRDLASLPSGHIDRLDAVIGRSLRRPLAPGAPLTPDALAMAKLVKRGMMVMLVGRSGGLEVRTQGKALADGGDGDRIAVENLSSRRVVQGVIRDGGTVGVSL